MPERERRARTHAASARRQAQAKIRDFLKPRPPITGEARRQGVRQERQRFLIVCEGERTESLYFRGFRVQAPPIGVGQCTVSLVQDAIRLRGEKEVGYYDQCWVVFDRDDFPAADFNEAIRLAEASGFEAAHTNQAFELWYLLHFEAHEAAYDRTQYKEMLTDRLGRSYRKNDPSVYATLIAKQEAAIRNAESLMQRYDPHNPANDNPCTTVHRLVKELRRNTLE